jgi:hypothetical protein
MEALGKIADGIGQPVRRKEDSRLLTGQGQPSPTISSLQTPVGQLTSVKH